MPWALRSPALSKSIAGLPEPACSQGFLAHCMALLRARRTGPKFAADDRDARFAVAEDEAIILAELVRMARKALVPLAALDLSASYAKILKVNGRLGAETGTSIHIRVATIRLDAVGRVLPEDIKRFEFDCDTIRDTYYNQISTFMVSTALLMTVVVVLTLAEASHLYGDDTESYSPSLWGPDAASWLAPDNAVSVRRSFYAFEFTLLGLCLMLTISGVFLCNCQAAIMMGMPSNIAMMEYLIRGGLRSIPTLYMCVDLPFFFFPLALPFIAARYNAVAFFGACIIFIGYWVIVMPLFTCGPMHIYNRVLQTRARAAVRLGDGCAPPSTGSPAHLEA